MWFEIFYLLYKFIVMFLYLSFKVSIFIIERLWKNIFIFVFLGIIFNVVDKVMFCEGFLLVFKCVK